MKAIELGALQSDLHMIQLHMAQASDDTVSRPLRDAHMRAASDIVARLHRHAMRKRLEASIDEHILDIPGEFVIGDDGEVVPARFVPKFMQISACRPTHVATN